MLPAAAGSGLLQRRQATRTARRHTASEAIQRIPPPKDPEPDTNLFNELRFDERFSKTEVKNDLKNSAHAKQPSKSFPSPPDAPLFPVTIDAAVSKKLPPGYTIRSLQLTDNQKGYTNLKRLGPISPQAWTERCEYLRSRPEIYTILVITFPSSSPQEEERICCTGTLFLERKLTRNMSIVGHIQDIVVGEGHKGKNLSYRMLSQLERLAYSAGATRIVADTRVENLWFYQQKGFEQTGIEMTRSFLGSGSAAVKGEDEQRRNKSRSPSFERLDRELALAAESFGGVSGGGPGLDHVSWSPVLV